MSDARYTGPLDPSYTMGEASPLARRVTPQPGDVFGARAVPGAGMRDIRTAMRPTVEQLHTAPDPLDAMLQLGGGPGGSAVAMAAGPAKALRSKAAAQMLPKAQFPELAERYPETGPPEMRVDKKKGTTYPGKLQTPQEKLFMEARLAIQKDLDAGNYRPYFPASKRFDAPAKDLASPRQTRTETLPGPRTKPENLAKWQEMINDPAGHQRLRDMFEHGRDVGGGENWYMIGQLHAKFRQELGQQAGDQKFKEFVWAMTGTTSGVEPEDNLMIAHLVRYARENNIPLPQAPHQVPSPVSGGKYGVMGNLKLGKQMVEQGVDPSNPKRFNYGQNFFGKADVSTLDEQMGNIWFGRDVEAPFAKSGGPYGLFEPTIERLAAEYGVSPREFQEVAWAGYKNKTRGYRPKPFITTINEAIERTHRLTGMPHEEIVRRGLVRGEIPLYGAAGVLGLDAALQQQGQNSPLSQPQYASTPMPRPAPRPKDRPFTEADRAEEMRAMGQMGQAMQGAGMLLPGPNSPLSKNVIDRTTPLYTRAYYQEQGRRRGPVLDVANQEVK